MPRSLADTQSTYSPEFNVAGQRLLLVAPYASYRIAPYMDAARRRGVDVTLATQAQQSLLPSGYDGIRIRFDQPSQALDAILHRAQATPFSAVLSGDDQAAEIAAQAAERLGLAHNKPDAVRIAGRKDLARATLSRAGVAVPGFLLVSFPEPLAAQIADVRFPCVVKPLALSGSRGVIRADNVHALGKALNRVRRILQSDRAPQGDYALIEDFIPGAEVALEGMLTGGRLSVLAIFDKPDPLDGPFFEETYYITPTRLPDAICAVLQEQVERACNAYGLREGPVHAECRINDQGVWVLEVAARTIGGLCSRLFNFGVGENLETLVVRHALGEPVEPTAMTGGAGVLMIPIPVAGVLRRVEGVMQANRVRYIEEVIINVREGYELVPLPEGNSYLGFIYARAPSAELAERALREAHACLNVVVAPLWKGAAGMGDNAANDK